MNNSYDRNMSEHVKTIYFVYNEQNRLNNLYKFFCQKPFTMSLLSKIFKNFLKSVFICNNEIQDRTLKSKYYYFHVSITLYKNILLPVAILSSRISWLGILIRFDNSFTLYNCIDIDLFFSGESNTKTAL